MERNNKINIRVKNISKKFCRDIRNNLWYSFQDVLKKQIGISIRSNRLRPKEFWALKNITFDIYGGEVTAIIGMNGSGKTTLTRIMSDIFQADQGEVIIADKLKITPIFALSAGLRPLFTGRENIFIKGAAYGMDKNTLENKINDIISFSEIGDFIDTPVGSYSSGMRSRLSYSIAVATHPDIFIIDEALAVGDSIFRTKCFEHIQNMIQDENKSVIYVTNHIDKVLRIAQRLLVLDKGELVKDTRDITEGLLFYVNHCFKGQSLERKNKLLDLVNQWGSDE